METNLLFFHLVPFLFLYLCKAAGRGKLGEWRKETSSSEESWPLVKGKMVCYFAVAGGLSLDFLFSALPAKANHSTKQWAWFFSFFFFALVACVATRNEESGLLFSRLTWTCK